MSERNTAVFLSYASQDAEAARRIRDVLRAAGIEVWLDQSELRGGDAWDQHIRQQIRACALFIPIISAHTQTRLEGYFRREWRLAVDRTLDMADDKPFLVPVVINDDIVEEDAHVPEAFRAVHWTSLPEGETSSAFAQHVSRLLERGIPGSAASSSPHQASRVGAEYERPATKPEVIPQDNCRDTGRCGCGHHLRLLRVRAVRAHHKLGPATWAMPPPLRDRPRRRRVHLRRKRIRSRCCHLPISVPARIRSI